MTSYGDSEQNILVVQSNLAGTYQALGRIEQALSMRKDVYSVRLRLDGEEKERTLNAANNYAWNLISLNRHKEAKSLLRKMVPVARRVLGEDNRLTLQMRWHYAQSLSLDASATVNDLHEAVNTLEDAERIARRVLGTAHPVASGIKTGLKRFKAVLAARAQDGQRASPP